MGSYSGLSPNFDATRSMTLPESFAAMNTCSLFCLQITMLKLYTKYLKYKHIYLASFETECVSQNYEFDDVVEPPEGAKKTRIVPTLAPYRGCN